MIDAPGNAARPGDSNSDALGQTAQFRTTLHPAKFSERRSGRYLERPDAANRGLRPDHRRPVAQPSWQNTSA
ncbi:hypothetical protein NO357_06955 [Marimonas arenosa]|uniref:Uncharacterized protein n=1 Tax=Marimonas arenosa TaxID=1795305 RepID=A0AAE3WBG3_9RHOB|nr:hypothetical protein [Marimonas arenosa]